MANINLTVDYSQVTNAQKEVTKLKNIASDIKTIKINVDTSTGKQALNSYSQSVKNINQDYGDLTKTVEKNGKLQYKTYTKVSDNIKTVTKVQGENVTVTNKYAAATQKAGRHTMTFGEQLGEAYKKFAVWSVATVSWYQVVNAIKDMVIQVKELDDSLVELQKVSDLEGKSLEEFTDKAFKAADKVAKTGSQMVNASTEFAKSGFDESQILQLGEIALMYTNIADEELSAADAASFMIAQMKAFNIEAEKAEHIVDALNEV